VVPGIEGDYRRRDALALRRHLMQQWAKFIEQPWGEHSHNVVKFRDECYSAASRPGPTTSRSIHDTQPENRSRLCQLFNVIYEHAGSSARQVRDQKDQGASCFDGFVAGAMPVRHGGCRLTLRLAAAPRRHIAERGKCRGPFRAARSWFSRVSSAADVGG
jgi:hypothetical protein